MGNVGGLATGRRIRMRPGSIDHVGIKKWQMDDQEAFALRIALIMLSRELEITQGMQGGKRLGLRLVGSGL